MDSEIDLLVGAVRRFRDDRDWGQFHTLKHLAAGLAIEASELQELLLWKGDDEVDALAHTESGKERLRHEVADIMIFVLLLADKLDIDLSQTVREKIELNANKYPIDKARGNHTKYTAWQS